MDIIEKTYKDLLLQTKRGNNRGIISNAKPIFVLSIIDAISQGVIIGNKIEFENKDLQEIYQKSFVSYQNKSTSIFRANIYVTPYNLPYFHLNAEPYYHIKWQDGITPPQQAKSPSFKFLKENVQFSYLDNELWNILQATEIRTEYQESLIKRFFSNDK